MLLTQSRTQHLFSLLIFYCILMVGFAVVTLITHPLSEFFDEMLFSALKWFAIFSVIFLWLAIFNSGWSKLTERGVTLDESGIGYVYWGREVKVLWHEITSWNVKKGVFGQFFVNGKDNKHLRFSYYTFSSWQRDKIHQALLNHCPDKQKKSTE